MIKQLIKYVAGIFGVSIIRKSRPSMVAHNAEVSNPFIYYDYGEDGWNAIQLVKDYTMLPQVNLMTLFEQVVYCEKNDIEGAFVECGVWKGGAVGVMARANQIYGSEKRQLHLYDSFDDINPPDAKVDGAKAIADAQQLMGLPEVEKMNGQLEAIKGGYDKLGGHGTIEICDHLLVDILKYPKEYLHYHKGWFQDTLPLTKNAVGKIAVLRLDGDWYDAIKVCLENLYDKVEKGGIVIIDDYGYYDGCTKAVNDFLIERNIKTFLSYSRVNCRYFVKP